MRDERFGFDFHHFPMPSADTRIPRKGRSLSNAFQFGPRHLTSLSNSSRRATRRLRPVTNRGIYRFARLLISYLEGDRNIGTPWISAWIRSKAISRGSRAIGDPCSAEYREGVRVDYVLAELLAGPLRNDPLLLFRRRKTSSPLPNAKLIPLSSRVSCEARVVRGSAEGSLPGS